jgi:TonB family protein
MYASPARSTLISGAIHAIAIALILLATRAQPRVVKEHAILFTPVDLLTYRVNIPQRSNAGGGGGMRAPAPASLGSLPKVRPWQYLAPMIRTDQVEHPLIVEPTIIGDERTVVEHVDLGRLGDPHGVPGPPSAGRGDGGGIGDGHGTGVGDGKGPGAGIGEGGGIASGNSGFKGSLTQPVLLYKTEPEYSEDARKVRLQGAVTLRVEIDPHGQVQNIAVAQTLGLGLDERAIEAVRKWRFRAGMQNGRPVTTQALIQVTFRLL